MKWSTVRISHCRDHHLHSRSGGNFIVPLKTEYMDIKAQRPAGNRTANTQFLDQFPMQKGNRCFQSSHGRVDTGYMSYKCNPRKILKGNKFTIYSLLIKWLGLIWILPINNSDSRIKSVNIKQKPLYLSDLEHLSWCYRFSYPAHLTSHKTWCA